MAQIDPKFAVEFYRAHAHKIDPLIYDFMKRPSSFVESIRVTPIDPFPPMFVWSGRKGDDPVPHYTTITAIDLVAHNLGHTVELRAADQASLDLIDKWVQRNGDSHGQHRAAVAPPPRTAAAGHTADPDRGAAIQAAINAVHSARVLSVFPGDDAVDLPIENAGICPCITGWRAWLVTGDENFVSGYALRSVYRQSCVWPADTRIQTGLLGAGAWAGVHAWNTREGAARYVKWQSPGRYVIGQVELWGEVVTHEDGYRAENARIKSLDEAFGDVDLIALRRRYGIPA